MRTNILVLCAVMLIVLFTGGCGGKSVKKTFLRENVDLGFITRVAVLPFENQSSEKFAGEKIRNITVTHVLAREAFDAVDKGLVDSALQEEAIEPGKPLDLNSIKRLGQRLNVQAFVMGSVEEAGTGKSGSYAYSEWSLTLRLVETNAAVVLWQASGHRSGDSLMGRLFGLTPQDSYQVADKLVKSLLRSLPSK